MANQHKPPAPDPVERTRKYLEAHQELSDVRWHTLLLFNAFEETARMYLAWRLSCDESDLPGASNNPSLLFDFMLPGNKEVREWARKFAEARNAIAHRFHENKYEEKLNDFVRSVSKKDLPHDDDERLVALSDAVFVLSLYVGGAMQSVPLRPPTPFPELASTISSTVGQRKKLDTPG